ncbi:V-type proton ATPase subunit G1-like protein [Tanacetum coccineum]
MNVINPHFDGSTTAYCMEDYRRQGGIQQLLVAEQEARQIVNAARTAKMNRLKQAKDEAEEEVAKYREQMENEYRKTISESTGFSGTNVKRLDDETAKKIDQLKKKAGKVSPEVIKMLMTQVTVVKV